MECKDVLQQLTELWNDAVDPQVRDDLERHLAGCESCRREARELEGLWTKLGSAEGTLPEVPSAALRESFYPALDRARRAERETLATRIVRWLGLDGVSGALRPAWSFPSMLLAVAFGASLMWAWTAHQRIETLSAEVASMSRAASLSLLAHDSASERLRGVSIGSRALSDDRIVEALLASVRDDPSVNVRLAALETLALMDSPRVHAGLVETLPRMSSPALQVALVEVLNEKSGNREAIERFLEREDLDPLVRDRISHLLQSV